MQKQNTIPFALLLLFTTIILSACEKDLDPTPAATPPPAHQLSGSIHNQDIHWHNAHTYHCESSSLAALPGDPFHTAYLTTGTTFFAPATSSDQPTLTILFNLEQPKTGDITPAEAHKLLQHREWTFSTDHQFAGIRIEYTDGQEPRPWRSDLGPQTDAVFFIEELGSLPPSTQLPTTLIKGWFRCNLYQPDGRTIHQANIHFQAEFCLRRF